LAGWKRTPFWTYLILQLPDILLVGLILLFLYRWEVLPLAWAVGLLVAWAAKDLAFYPLVKDAFAPPRTGPESLIGARAVAHDRLAPEGLVRLGAELWRGEALHPDRPIAGGCSVVVRGRRGLTLVVEAEAPARTDEGAADRDGSPARPEPPG